MAPKDRLAGTSRRAKNVADGRQTNPNAVSGKHLASFVVKSASPPVSIDPSAVWMRKTGGTPLLGGKRTFLPLKSDFSPKADGNQHPLKLLFLTLLRHLYVSGGGSLLHIPLSQ